MMSSIKKYLKDHVIEDIILVGFVDIEDGEAQFCPDLRYMYFEFDSKLVEFESIEQFSKLKLSLLDCIRYNYEIDEDMIKGKTSIKEIVLDDTMNRDNNFEKMIFYNLEYKGEDIVCDALEIILVNGQLIFLDPSYFFGINIGGLKQKEKWEDNLSEDYILNITSVMFHD